MRSRQSRVVGCEGGKTSQLLTIRMRSPGWAWYGRNGERSAIWEFRRCHSPVSGGHGFEGAERMGQGLAAALLERLPRTTLTNQIAFGVIGLDIAMPPLNWRLTDGLRLRPGLAQRLLHARGRSFIQVFRLEDSLWASTPCDFSGELALTIKDFLRARGMDGVITSFNGDYVGYVIPSRYYHLEGYEPRVMSFFGPNVPHYFDEFIRAMALDLATE